MHYDHRSFCALILRPGAAGSLFHRDFTEFGHAGQPGPNFRISQANDSRLKRETFGAVFNLSKVRCLGAVANKGDPHFYRNAGNLHNVDSFNMITDGVSLKLSFKHTGPGIMLYKLTL